MKDFRSKVFKQAYEMMKATGKAFAVCLAKACAIRLYKCMKSEAASFAYEKVNGSLRRTKGILQDVSNLIKGTGSDNYKTVRYFDVEANGFRSFKVENLITVYDESGGMITVGLTASSIIKQVSMQMIRITELIENGQI